MLSLRLLALITLGIAPAALATPPRFTWKALARGMTDFGTHKVKIDSDNPEQAYVEIKGALKEGHGVIAKGRGNTIDAQVLAAKGDKVRISPLDTDGSKKVSLAKFAENYKNVHITNQPNGTYIGD
jgi:hypothetical protein